MNKQQWFRSSGKKAFSLAVFVGLGSLGIFAASAHAAQTIDCASEQGRHRYCRVQTNGYVRLDEQLSDAACVAGRTWGYDESGIWVDDGCRARFIVGRQGYYNEPRRRPRDYDSRDYYDESAPAAQSINCASKGGQYTYCATDTGGYVRLERHLSATQCEQWRSWGYESGAIRADPV